MSGSELEPLHHREILDILLPKWRDADPYLDDIVTVMRNSAGEILVRISDGRIDGVLRTKCIRTGGDPHRIPATFEELVGPHWSRHDANPDTRILVDLTKRDEASGVARSLIPLCLNRFAEPNLGTFSPEEAAALHMHFGGYSVRRIANARRRHSSPNVVVMCYRGFAESR